MKWRWSDRSAHSALFPIQVKRLKAGVTVHVLRAGSMKGFGTPGTEITDEGLASIQVIVNGLNTFFLDAVSEGRKMEIAQVAAIADGRVHLAAKAKEMGLIDAVSDFETAFPKFSECFSGIVKSGDASYS
ncbi:MAG: S49 family peptidase [Chloracidobacterium sp.]|nr:S49 family peptidase [Chloracidobacterium sp.]